jgi:hypothetical protein
MERAQLAAVAQVVLEGAPLPAEKRELIEYATAQNAPVPVLGALALLPDRSYEHLDAVGEALERRQPSFERARVDLPREESDAVPGGAAYVEPHPEPGGVRDAGD